jgi:hypothetical protein
MFLADDIAQEDIATRSLRARKIRAFRHASDECRAENRSQRRPIRSAM